MKCGNVLLFYCDFAAVDTPFLGSTPERNSYDNVAGWLGVRQTPVLYQKHHTVWFNDDCKIATKDRKKGST